MMNKAVKTVLSAALACCGFVFPAQADSISARGVDVAYAGAAEAKTLADGDVVLVFTNTQAQGSFTLPKNAKARVVAVGGGGAGGSLAAVDELGMGSAGGGGAGGVSDHETILYPGDYTVTVGAGGARVQTIVQSWVGANGGNTTLSLNGQPLVAGKGGGGGGSVKVNGRGEAGGSGGGGSWYGDFLKAGAATDGQGWAGAMPADTSCGGGGGGAALTAADGAGRADGTAGAGRALDVTGEEIVYGQGGAGGRRAAGTAVAADGAGFGFGGAGANVTGRGGAGGDGVLVVRIHKLFDYVHVDKPAVPSFTWKNGESYVAFDEANVAEPLKSAIDYIEGVTATNASLVRVDAQNVTTNGLGRFYYAIHLKDEYVWNDGTAEGSTKPFVAYWRVKEPGTIGEATVEVTKTVDWSEGNKATIAIDIKTTPEKMEHIPNVLVLGSLCGAHGFSSDVFNAALNAITEVGNVDYYFFNENNSKTSVAAALSGSLKKGQKKSGQVYVGSTKLESKTGNHGTLYEFYAQLSTVIKEIKLGTREEYDYIVFSFDRGLVASSFVGTHPDEAAVVEYVKKFYASKSVIWLVDKEAGSDEKLPSSIKQTPWFPCPIVYVSGSNYNYWSPLDYYVSKWGADAQKSSPYGYAAYKAELGLFCPSKYAALTQNAYGATTDVTKLSGSSTTANKRALNLAGTAIAEQEIYDDAVKVSTLIKNVVKEKPATIVMQDNIYVESGLKIDRGLTAGQWTTNETKMGWRTLTASQLTLTDKGVKIALPGILDPCEIKLSIGVEDTGAFRSSLNAKYNEKTGLWEKDPNNGPVHVTLTPDGGEAILAEAEASTAVAWSFPTYKITGTVVHGEGEIVLNGFITNKLDVAAGCTPEVVFRGKGGYVLDYLEVDGQVVTDFDKDLYNWYFNEVGADHDIKVGFKPVFTVPYPTTTPTVGEYNGSDYVPGVTPPTFIPGYDYEWKAMYSMESNGVYTADGGEVNVVRDANGNVISTNVYVRIWINQPGYEDGVVIDYWTGCDQVTVTPRPITVKYDDYAQTSSQKKTGDFSSSIVSGSLVPGDTLVPNGGQCTRYPNKGDKTVGSITAKGDVAVTTPDFDGNNYTVTVLPGDYYYPDQTLVAKATNVTKPYDGVSATTDVTVLHPANVSEGTHTSTGNWTESKSSSSKNYNDVRTRTVTNMTLKVEYSVDGGKTYTATKPTFTDAGEHPITYRVTYVGEYHTETQRRYSKNGTWYDSSTGKSTEITYDPYVGTATITITPRPVTVIAGNAEKEYDGKALTQASYTVSATTETAGFIKGEGIATAPMTADSTLTNPGIKSNKVAQDQVTFVAGTKLENYAITYVDGQLKVTPNPLQAVATKVEKVYDGTPTDPIAVTVVDSHGNPLPAGSYTITYKTSPNGTPSTTMPQTPTDAGEYPVFYTVDGGPGYGVVSGVTTIKVTPRTVTLKANDAEKAFDGTPLTETGFTVVSGGAGEAVGFVGDEGIASVTTTPESEQTEVGSTANVIDVYDTEHWEMKPGTKVQNYVFEVLPGTLTVTPNLNLPPVLPKNPSKVKEPTYEGDAFQNPGSPDYPGYSAWNDDPENPWWTVLDPLDPTTPADPADPSKGVVTNFVGQTPTTLVPGEETKLRFEVVGDGEFKWSSLVTDKTPGANPPQVLVIVDGKTNQIYATESDWTEHVLHVTDEPGKDGATHTVEVVFVNGGDTGDSTMFLDKVDFTPSATKAEIQQIADTDPPSESAEEAQKQITVTNSPTSGWMPVKDPETGKITGVRSPDGTEGTSTTNDLDSTFGLAVTGTGEIKVGKITIPVKDPEDPARNSDKGLLTITVDDKVFEIPPIPDETVSYTITTNGDMVVIENLVIKVTGEPDQEHTVVFEYTRDADDKSGNTAAVIEHITWKTYGESGDGGSSWLQGKALWIIDHEDPGDGYVYLAFEPELKVEEELNAWVRRSDANDMIRVKYGRTREAADACTPVIAHLSDKHQVTPVKVWIKVALEDMNKVTIVEPVGFWRIYIDGPAIQLSGTGPAKARSAGFQDATPIVGEGAVSVNTFGILKIESATTNTLIAVPWTWYSKDQQDAKDIPVAKLVKTTNLSEDDTLLAYVANGTYAAWTVDQGEWTPLETVNVEAAASALEISDPKAATGKMAIVSDDATKPITNQLSIARGKGLWLCRKNPLNADGTPKPFWIYGQSVTTDVETEIVAPPATGTGTTNVVSNILGNPYAQETSINDLVFDGTIDKNDRIWIPNGTKTAFYVMYMEKKGGWCYSGLDPVTRKTTYITDIRVPAGLGFWYDRRGKTPMRIRWTKKAVAE